ncbi:hypothetical protein BDZ89DRAFT_1049063 [Hymenopellis radicata]|nr:hypothetical protein BDZ89DRAFT_1049063 [Hymenopellis radicata]
METEYYQLTQETLDALDTMGWTTNVVAEKIDLLVSLSSSPMRRGQTIAVKRQHLLSEDLFNMSPAEQLLHQLSKEGQWTETAQAHQQALKEQQKQESEELEQKKREAQEQQDAQARQRALDEQQELEQKKREAQEQKDTQARQRALDEQQELEQKKREAQEQKDAQARAGARAEETRSSGAEGCPSTSASSGRAAGAGEEEREAQEQKDAQAHQRALEEQQELEQEETRGSGAEGRPSTSASSGEQQELEQKKREAQEQKDAQAHQRALEEQQELERKTREAQEQKDAQAHQRALEEQQELERKTREAQEQKDAQAHQRALEEQQTAKQDQLAPEQHHDPSATPIRIIISLRDGQTQYQVAPSVYDYTHHIVLPQHITDRLERKNAPRRENSTDLQIQELSTIGLHLDDVKLRELDDLFYKIQIPLLHRCAHFLLTRDVQHDMDPGEESSTGKLKSSKTPPRNTIPQRPKTVQIYAIAYHDTRYLDKVLPLKVWGQLFDRQPEWISSFLKCGDIIKKEEHGGVSAVKANTALQADLESLDKRKGMGYAPKVFLEGLKRHYSGN